MQSICIIAIIKNESAYLKEWILYHKMIGVNHFIIYDNNSNDNLYSEIEKFILHGLVTLIHFPHKINAQIDAYNHALSQASAYDWILVIDPDEFLDICDYSTIQNFLSEFGEDVSSIQFPWKTFNNSGHLNKPESLVIEAYTFCDPNEQNQEINMVKSLSKVEKVSSVSVHQCVTIEGKTMKNSIEETGDRPTWYIKNANFNYPTINHYFTKSLEEFTNKISRGQSNGTKEKKLNLFNSNIGSHQDFRIQKRVMELKNFIAEFELLSPNPSIYGDAYGMNHQKDYFDSEFNRYIHDTLVKKEDLSHAAPDLEPIIISHSLRIYPVSTISKRLQIEQNDNNIFFGVHYDDFIRILNIDTVSNIEINCENKIESVYSCRLYLVITIKKDEMLQFQIFFNEKNVADINTSGLNEDLIILYKFNDGKLIYSNKNSIRIEANTPSSFMSQKIITRY